MNREGAHDSLHEVSKMNTTVNINCPVDNWITEEDLPASASLKVVRINSPSYGLTEDEITDRNEFIRCYLFSDFELLMMIPNQTPTTDFFFSDVDVSHAEYSAFNTVDFQRTRRPFDRYAYAMKKIMARIQDLAIIHSSTSSEDGRKHTYQRYKRLVEVEFRERLFELVAQYRNTWSLERRSAIKQKIGEINRRIMECRRVWERHAPPSVWDF